MHSFQDLDITTLRKICSRYNLHIKITKYSKLTKEQLIPHMEKHLHINSEGKIKIKKEHPEMAETELNKMLHDLKNKVKEVKEKVIKHHAKKEEMKPKKEIQIDEMTEKEKAKKTLKHYSDISNWEKTKRRERLTAFKNMINEGLLEEILKVNHLNLFYKKYENYLKGEKKEDAKEDKKEKKQKKTEEQIKEEEIIEALPMYHKLNDYEGVERVTKLNDMCLKMEHFPTIVKCLEGIEQYLEKHPEADKPKSKKEKNPMDKIDKIQNELNKLEQLIKIDEKQNEKEHKQLKKEIKDNESDNEEYNAMKPKKASDVLILKVSEVKDLAKKHNISLKHKVNNKEVAKGGPMLKKEIIKYLKL